MEPQFVDVTDGEHTAALHRWVGQLEVLHALEDKTKEFDRLPGFGLALAIVQREVADSRAKAVTDNLRAIARAGINILEVKNVGLELGKRARLRVEMMDLADLAGGGE